MSQEEKEQPVKIKDFLTKENWTKGAYARDQCNYTINFMSPLACKFCLMGAFLRHNQIMSSQFKSLIDELGGVLISEWNDAPERTFEDVHNLCVKLDI